MHRLRSVALILILGLAGACMGTGASAATVIATLNSVGTGNTITMHAVRPNGTPFAS
ncbi:MAG: hypothetical protein ACLGHK_16430 [Alphaproteobacteria bacterium]